MEENNDTYSNFEANTADLQNIQNQTRSISQTEVNPNKTWSEATYEKFIKETWSETFYHWYTYGKITKDVYDLGKAVAPAETVRRIAKYTINPVTGMMDYYTGFKDKKKTVRGYEVPCSFSLWGKVFTESLAFTVNPAQWGAYQIINMTGSYLTKKALENSSIQNKEAKAAITLGSSVILQKAWGKLEETNRVKSVYEVCKQPLQRANKALDKVTNYTDDKVINKAIGKIGIDPKNLLFLTDGDRQREKNLIAAEKNLADTEEKLEQLTKQEKDLKDLLADAQKNKNDLEVEKAQRDAIDIKTRIQQARDNERKYIERKNKANYKKNKFSKKIISKELAEIFKKEDKLSDQDADRYAGELLKELKHAKGEKRLNKIFERKSKEYKAILQEQSFIKQNEANRKIAELQQLLDDTRRAKAKTERREIAAAGKKYDKAADEFKKSTNPYQQNKFAKEQEKRQKEREDTKNIIDTNLPLSGNIQFGISLSEIEKMINDYIKDNQLFRENLNDGEIKVFLDLKGEERIKISHHEGNNLQIAVPIKIDNKRNVYSGVKGKVSKIQLEVTFNLQLQESNAEKLFNANIAQPSFAMKNPVFFKVLAVPPKINIQNMAHEMITERFPEAMLKIKNRLEEALGKENICNLINKNIPTGVGINESNISIRAPRIKDGNTLFDADVNADFQYRISAETLQNEFRPFTFNAELLGLPLGGYSVDNLANVNMTNGRIKADLSLSGPISGTLTASFKTQFLNNEQRFIVDNLQFDNINTNSKLVQTINAWPRALQNCLPLHNKIEETFNHILRNAPSSIINHIQEQTPGNLIVDRDSANIRQILLDNNSMTVNGTLSSDNNITESANPNRSSFFYSNRTNIDPLQEAITDSLITDLVSDLRL